jgi:hypothetical protein
MVAFVRAAAGVALLTCLAHAAIAGDPGQDSYGEIPSERFDTVFYVDDQRWLTHGLVPVQSDETRSPFDTLGCPE